MRSAFAAEEVRQLSADAAGGAGYQRNAIRKGGHDGSEVNGGRLLYSIPVPVRVNNPALCTTDKSPSDGPDGPDERPARSAIFPPVRAALPAVCRALVQFACDRKRSSDAASRRSPPLRPVFATGMRFVRATVPLPTGVA